MKEAPVYWWRDDDKAQPVDRLRRTLNAVVGPDCRLEMKIENGQAYFRVVAGSPAARAALVADLGEDCEEWVNNSHVCPPQCP